MSSGEQPRGTPSLGATTRAATDSFAWSLLQAMPDGVVMVDDGGRIVFANRRAETLFGYQRGELLGELIEVLIPPDLHDTHREHRARYGDAPDARPMGVGLRLAGVRRDGTRVPLDISLSPLVEGSRRLIVAAIRPHSDAERDRLATELLDSIIHRLFTIGMSLQSAGEAPEAQLRQRVSEAVDGLDRATIEIRTILYRAPHSHHPGDETPSAP